MQIIAFVVAIPVGIELIAALYGPIDLAAWRGRMLLALVRLVLIASVATGLGLWLDRGFLWGLAFVAAVFVIKHWLIVLAYRRPGEHKVPIWTSEQAKKIPGDK